jgi:hypothetical protein
MGQSQAARPNWSVDDWAFGTGANAMTAEEMIAETKKIPSKLFGGDAIESDASMHQMQRDLLSFDDALKRLFRRKKRKHSKQAAYDEQYDYQNDQEQSPAYADDNNEYLAPVAFVADSAGLDASVPHDNVEQTGDTVKNSNPKLFWRCTQCTADNKITESSCRRCGLIETAF